MASVPAAAAVSSTTLAVRKPVTIATTDGVQLSAFLWRPSGSGYPLVVMPAAWAEDRTEYDTTPPIWAAAGYAVSIPQRGFGTSTGSVDMAGPGTRGDVSTVISWALANTAADPGKVGILGMSYGAGVSLLAAAADRRIRAVAALGAWSDMAGAMDPNNSFKRTTLQALLNTAPRVTTEVAQLRNSVNANLTSAATAQLAAMSPSRRPVPSCRASTRTVPPSSWSTACRTPSSRPIRSARSMHRCQRRSGSRRYPGITSRRGRARHSSQGGRGRTSRHGSTTTWTVS